MDKSEDVHLNQRYSDLGQSDFHVSDQSRSRVFPGYTSAWTQFSGMPQPEADQEVFKWETFATPPPTPTSGNLNLRTSTSDPFSVFSHYHTGIPGLRTESPTDFDADQREADNVLASTPLAQSLLEASLRGSIDPNAMQNGPVVDEAPYAFQETSQDGYNMYVEAMKKWEAFQSFNPFATPDVLSSSLTTPEPSVPISSPSPPPPSEPIEKVPTARSNSNSSNSNCKPSYSEVAKTIKNKPSSSHKEEETIANSKKKHSEMAAPKPAKVGKKFVPRVVRGVGGAAGGTNLTDDLMTTVSPGSKYGLDQFEDLPGSRECDKEESDRDPLLLRRKGSASSLSSGTSGIDEIQLTKPPPSSYSRSSQNSVDRESKVRGSKDKSKSFLNEDLVHENNVKPFFDVRRIFQSKDTNKSSGSSDLKKSTSEGTPHSGSTMLNNGKPSYGAVHTKKNTHYINNDLRDSRKKTNQNPSSSSAPSQSENNPPSFMHHPGRGAEKRTKSSGPSSSSASCDKNQGQSKAKQSLPLQTTFDQELIDEWLSYLYDKVCVCTRHVWTLLLMLILLLFSIVVYVVSGCIQLLAFLWGKGWYLVETKIFKRSAKWRKTSPETPKKYGLDENIALPSTGDEAMQRLLACKGKDPYSILGLKAAATDDDIKKYYRRQAVLVHPDKNQQPGAEEAFKILGHAFDLIGDASKRQVYDRQLHEATEAETAMREFNDLLSKLQEKIHEAANMMRCDNCGGKHKRTPVERPWYSARFCDRCNIRHSAKEGDVWAETSMLGFLWHYYACMEGKVFDITEWVACKKDFFKHMQANAHHVFYRIATDGNRGQQHGRSGTGEADLEDFISHLFHQAMSSDGSSQWQQPQQPGAGNGSSNGTGPNTWNGSSSTAGTTSHKRNKRRKKKH